MACCLLSGGGACASHLMMLVGPGLRLNTRELSRSRGPACPEEVLSSISCVQYIIQGCRLDSKQYVRLLVGVAVECRLGRRKG